MSVAVCDFCLCEYFVDVFVFDFHSHVLFVDLFLDLFVFWTVVVLFIFLGNYVALALLLLLPSLIPPRSLVSSSYHFVFFFFLFSPFFSNIFLLPFCLFLCPFFFSNLVHVGCLLRKIHWCSICWHIERIFPWMHLRVVINFAGGGPSSAFNPKFCSISSFCSLHSLWQNASLSPVLWWKCCFTICFTLLGFQQSSLHFL